MGGLIRYDDMLGAAQAAQGVSQLVVEQYRDTGFLMPFFQHNQNDILYFTFQFSHRKRLGSALASIHIHCVPMVDPAVSPQNVYFFYKYSWQTADGVFPANASWTSGNATMPVVTGDAFKHKYFSLVANIAAPAGEGYSSVLLCAVQRLGTDANDTYDTNKVGGTGQANLGLLYVDCHYETERRGSLLQGGDV